MDMALEDMDKKAVYIDMTLEEALGSAKSFDNKDSPLLDESEVNSLKVKEKQESSNTINRPTYDGIRDFPRKPAVSSNEGTFSCNVCLEDVPKKDCSTLDCKCSFCINCLKKYVESEIKVAKCKIVCPNKDECRRSMLLSELECFVSSDLLQKYKLVCADREVQLDKKQVWCPRVGCETVCFVKDADRTVAQTVSCSKCGTDFCCKCRADWHAGRECNKEDSELDEGEKVKQCPQCATPIVKDEGCPRVTCNRCQHTFCWNCVESLENDPRMLHRCDQSSNRVSPPESPKIWLYFTIWAVLLILALALYCLLLAMWPEYLYLVPIIGVACAFVVFIPLMKVLGRIIREGEARDSELRIAVEQVLEPRDGLMSSPVDEQLPEEVSDDFYSGRRKSCDF